MVMRKALGARWHLPCQPLSAQRAFVGVQESKSRQQQERQVEALTAEAAAAKVEVAALKALKKTLIEQVLSNEAQVTCSTRPFHESQYQYLCLSSWSPPSDCYSPHMRTALQRYILACAAGFHQAMMVLSAGGVPLQKAAGGQVGLR